MAAAAHDVAGAMRASRGAAASRTTEEALCEPRECATGAAGAGGAATTTARGASTHAALGTCLRRADKGARDLHRGLR